MLHYEIEHRHYNAMYIPTFNANLDIKQWLLSIATLIAL